MSPDLNRFERRLRRMGFWRIAGVDEAGRGAWAGPMVAAAVVLPEDFDVEGLDDSKALTAARREDWYERIRRYAIGIAVRRVSPARIDRAGLHRSNLAALREAVRRLPVAPDYVLCDGWPLAIDLPHLSLRNADALSASVAAASVVAKVVRDRAMARYARRYPGYGFESNKGYGTPEHRKALERLGPSPIHRRSFRGVAQPSMPNGRRG